MTQHFLHTPHRSGHTPELPLDPVEFGITAGNVRVFPTRNTDVLTEADNDIRLSRAEEQAAYAKGLEEGLEEGLIEAHKAYKAGFDDGNRNVREWTFAGGLAGFLLVVLLVGAFPEVGHLFLSAPRPEQIPSLVVAGR